jgi:hypothetical protein
MGYLCINAVSMPIHYIIIGSFVLVLIIVFLLLRDHRTHKRVYYTRTDRGWSLLHPENEDRILHTVLLIGDAGAPRLDGKDHMLNLLKREIEEAPEEHTTIFLGDNIYPRGLPPKGHRLRDISEKRLEAQMELFNNYKGNVYFVSGNHDWNKGKRNGYAYLQRQEKYVKEYMKRGQNYLPPNGCPGPTEVHLNDNLMILFVNTQWWIQRGYRPIGKTCDCCAESESHFFELFEKSIKQNQHKHILVAAHHPLYSNALHGGRFTTKHHVFPLTAIHKRLLLPIPVAGSLYPLYRKLFGAYEDMSHPRYKRMRKNLLRIIKKYKNIIYSAGHDHNLQYFQKGTNHFIVSGAGSKVGFVKHGRKSTFTHAHRGLFKLEYHSNGETWMKVIEPINEHKSKIVFRKKLEHASFAEPVLKGVSVA